jgi:hypothetical protein
MENEINLNRETKTDSLSLTPMATNYLQSAAPWIKFIGILGFIGSGFLLLVAVTMFFIPFPFPGQAPLFPGIGFISIIYFVLALITFIPCLYLLNYSNRLSGIKYSADAEATLEKAFMWQKKYWVFIGIVMIVYFSILFVVISGALIAAFALNAF